MKITAELMDKAYNVVADEAQKIGTTDDEWGQASNATDVIDAFFKSKDTIIAAAVKKVDTNSFCAGVVLGLKMAELGKEG